MWLNHDGFVGTCLGEWDCLYSTGKITSSREGNRFHKLTPLSPWTADGHADLLVLGFSNGGRRSTARLVIDLDRWQRGNATAIA